MAVTRSDLISTLKSRGVKGKLSKMRKHELQELVRQSAPADKREPTGIMLEPDKQAGGHYFNKKGETKSDGAHEHRTDPWPVTEKAKPKPKKKAPKKYNAVTDPKAKLTGKLVTQRLNERRHPATGKKLQPREGKSASAIAEAMRSIISANPIGASEIKDSDLERMQNIDQEAQDYLRSPAEVAQAERDSGPRKRRKPERLADQQPATFDVEREAEQDGDGMTYQEFMRKNLKQYGGNMKAAAAAYRSGQHGKGAGQPHYLPDGKLYTGPTHKMPDGSLHTGAKHSADSQPLSHQKGGHFVRRDGTVTEKEMAKYSAHTHRPKKNPAAGDTESEEEEPPSPEPQPRVTRRTDARERRRIDRNDPTLARFLASLSRGERSRAANAIKGYVEGPANLTVAEAIDRFKNEPLNRRNAVTGATDFDDSGEEDQPISGDQVGEGLEDWLDKHPFIQSIADDTVGALAVGGLALATGGLSLAEAPEEEAAVSGGLKLGEDALAKRAAQTTLEEGEWSSSKELQPLSSGAEEAAASENAVRQSAMPKSLGANTGIRPAQPLSEAEQSAFLNESARAGGVDARPAPTQDELDRAEAARVQADPNRPRAPRPPAPNSVTRGTVTNATARIAENTTGVAGIPRSAQDAVVSAQNAIQNATINTSTVLSDTARAAGEKASRALEDAKQAAIDAGKKELTKAKDDVTNAFQAKVKRGIGSLGLGFAENRGEQLGETFEGEFEADDKDKPRETRDSPGLLQTDADIRQLRGMFGHMSSEPGPRAFGNPWYS